MTLPRSAIGFPIFRPLIRPGKSTTGRFSPSTPRTRAELLGCLPNFKDLHKLEVTRKGFLTHEDNLIQSEICVISTALSRTLFPFGDALGQSINIGVETLSRSWAKWLLVSNLRTNRIKVSRNCLMTTFICLWKPCGQRSSITTTGIRWISSRVEDNPDGG